MLQWFVYMYVVFDGCVFYLGLLEMMYWMIMFDFGFIFVVGVRLGNDCYCIFGIVVMYDVGKVMFVGGNDCCFNLLLINLIVFFDIGGMMVQVSVGLVMEYVCVYYDLVVLLIGEVFVIGGNENGVVFNDDIVVLLVEIWNFEIGEWMMLVSMVVFCMYYLVVVLFQDGCVFFGGGGLCGGCFVNYLDMEIFFLFYFFVVDGFFVFRLQIVVVLGLLCVGGMFFVLIDMLIEEFNLVRFLSMIYSINSDQCFILVLLVDFGGNDYCFFFINNLNVLILGYYWIFVVDENGVFFVGFILQILFLMVLMIFNFGDQYLVFGSVVSLQIEVNDFDGDSLIYSVVGLLVGFVIDVVIGFIFGMVVEMGLNVVMVFVDDGENVLCSVSFFWNVDMIVVIYLSDFDFMVEMNGWGLMECDCLNGEMGVDDG